MAQVDISTMNNCDSRAISVDICSLTLCNVVTHLTSAKLESVRVVMFLNTSPPQSDNGQDKVTVVFRFRLDLVTVVFRFRLDH